MRGFWGGVLVCYLLITLLLTASMAQSHAMPRAELTIYGLTWPAFAFSHATRTEFLIKPLAMLVHYTAPERKRSSFRSPA